MASSLANIARIHDLVEEMNQLTRELGDTGVRVRIGKHPTLSDPLSMQAVVEIIFRTDMEPLNLGGSYG